MVAQIDDTLITAFPAKKAPFNQELHTPKKTTQIRIKNQKVTTNTIQKPNLKPNTPYYP
jgi:hypothetical protein